MGSKSKPKTPKAPDPRVIIPLQTQSNIDTARNQAQLNRINEQGPFGSLTYTQDPNNRDSYTRTTTLDPSLQNAIHQQHLLSAGLGTAALGRIDPVMSGLSNNLEAPNLDFSADRQRVEDALFARMEPYIQRDRNALENRLVNQGSVPGHESYRGEFDTFNKGVNDARLATILQAGTEQDRMANLAAQQFGLQAQARAIPLNELLALSGASQGVQEPGFQGSPQTGVQGTDVLGTYQNQYAGNLNAWNQANQIAAQGRSDLYGLGGTLGGAVLGSKFGPWGTAAGAGGGLLGLV